jgi:PKD repeat protein
VTVDQPSITVDEGRIIRNSGTAVDPDGDRVSHFDASAGNIFGNDDGIWSWVFAVADGPELSQTITVDASDEGGATGQATFELTVNNVPPVVVDEGTIFVEPPEPVILSGQEVRVTAVITDQGFLDTHVGVWAWDDGGGCTTGKDSDCTLDQSRGGAVVRGTHSYAEPGVYSIVLTVSDDDGGVAEAISAPIVVYDPEGGFVTGGGWIDSPAGAYIANPSLTGKATFGFVSKYQKGASEPDGKTQFQFHAGDLNFHSDSYEWLVVAGHKAQYKGTGTINGVGNYGFLLSAIDADLTPSTEVDRFRIKIWDRNAEDAIVYDNQMGDSDDADASTAIGGGSIVIHKAKGKK